MKQVLVIVERKMKHLFSDVDYQPLSSGQDIRWKNTAQFARYALVKRGLIKDFESAGRGVWELTEQGIAEIENNKSG
jgi:predicted transcriptional regulator